LAATVIDGKAIAAQMRAEFKEEVAQLVAQGSQPGLGVILVGDDPASRSYVTAKERACEKAGIYSDDNRLPCETSQEELLQLIEKMNKDPKIHGILLQLPLPGHVNESTALVAIDPDKDVDGFHPWTVGNMVIGEHTFLPCTPHGIVKLLERNDVQTSGAHVVIVGRSKIVGVPIANMMLQKKESGNATVTICHTGTRDLASFTRQADILIVAAGRRNTVTADMVKEGVVVIDVGVNRIKDDNKKLGFRLVGDVDFEKVKERASLITPVPGGVGPMTITMLLHNTIESAKRKLMEDKR